MERLRKTKEFSDVYHRGRSRADRNLVLYRLKREDNKIRLGISVSKKVGNSVVRHRLKRRIREAARLNEDDYFSDGCDYVVIVRKPAADADYAVLEHSLLKLSGKFKTEDV